jgi:hypothetical protein
MFSILCFTSIVWTSDILGLTIISTNWLERKNSDLYWRKLIGSADLSASSSSQSSSPFSTQNIRGLSMILNIDLSGDLVKRCRKVRTSKSVIRQSSPRLMENDLYLIINCDEIHIFFTENVCKINHGWPLTLLSNVHSPDAVTLRVELRDFHKEAAFVSKESGWMTNRSFLIDAHSLLANCPAPVTWSPSIFRACLFLGEKSRWMSSIFFLIALICFESWDAVCYLFNSVTAFTWLHWLQIVLFALGPHLLTHDLCEKWKE